MAIVKELPTRLVLVCCQQKDTGACCAERDSLKLHQYLKEKLRAYYGHEAISSTRVLKTSCLGQCETGPNIVIMPENIWYQCQTLDDINEVFQEHLIQGRKVERLLKQNPTK